VSGGRPSVWERAATRVEELDSKRVGFALLIVAMAASTTLILWIERGTLFASDEWSWVYISATGSFVDTLHPLNQHLMAVPLLVFKGLIAVWGLEMLPFKLAELAGIVCCSALVYVFARRRIGPTLALAPAMMPLFFGTGTAIMLQPLIGVQLIYAVAFGLGALLAIERGERNADVIACALLCLAITTFSTGLAFLVGAAVAILLSAQPLRRAYVFAVPLALYVGIRVWAIQFGTGGGPELGNVPILPFYFVDSLAATATSLFGRSAIVGAGPGTALFLQGFSLENAAATMVFATLEAVVVVYAARRLRGRGDIPVTFWTVFAVLVALWTMQGLVLNGGRTPGETRYLYASALILLLVVVEIARDVRLGRVGVMLVLAVALAGIVGNLPRFKEGRDGIVFHSPRARAYTAVIELAGSNANPNFNPAVEAPDVAPAGVLNFSASQHLELVRRYGSFAYSVPELIAQDERLRNGADVVAVDILGLRLQSIPRLPRHGCSAYNTGRAGGFVPLPRDGAIMQSSDDTRVSLRRFADKLVVPLGELKVGEPAALQIPPDRSGVRWKLDVEGPLTVDVCRLPQKSAGQSAGPGLSQQDQTRPDST
jgi:hypothetical protein